MARIILFSCCLLLIACGNPTPQPIPQPQINKNSAERDTLAVKKKTKSPKYGLDDIRNKETRPKWHRIAFDHPQLIKGNKVLVFDLMDSFYVNPLTIKNLSVSSVGGPYKVWDTKEFPEVLYRFKNLEIFSLWHSGIKKLPARFTEFKALRKVDMQYCALEELPENIGDLKKLQVISLQEIRLRKLPASILELSDLRKIRMGFSPDLTHIPPLEKLPKLDDIFIFNPSHPIHPRLLEQLKELETKMPECEMVVISEGENIINRRR